MKNHVMKRLLNVCFVTILIVLFSIQVYAIYSNGIFTSNSNNITVSIEGASNLTDGQIEKITNAVITHHCGHETVESSQPYGLTCVLFGHDKQLNMVSVIEHKVRATNPRCLETQYKVTTCSRCDYENIEYYTDTYISCCD